MHHIRPFIFAAFAFTLLFAAAVGCGQQTPAQASLSDSQVRQFATKYRDEWLKNASEDAAVLARSSITTVEKQPQVWHIIFMTPTGHSPATPEGKHDYYLHIYIKPDGKLDRVVRGPDLMS
jgi:hypothetical protein